MPKAELQVHLEGTLEAGLKFQLAARNRIDPPYRSATGMQAACTFDDLPSFPAMYHEGMSVPRPGEDFYDLAMAYFRKAHSQNVVHGRSLLRSPGAHVPPNRV